MALKRLWVRGAMGLVLGTSGCGGQRAADEHVADTSKTRNDAGRGDDGGSSDSVTHSNTPSTHDAGTGRCDTLPLGAGSNETEIETSTEPESDADAPSEDTTAEEPSTGALDVVAVPFEPEACTNGSWCWVTPDPIGERFNAISGTPDGNTVFAVGSEGACVQYDAVTDTWIVHQSTTRGDLMDVEVVSPTRVWVASQEGVDFYDGERWERQLVGWARSLVKGTGDELWAVNSEKLYAHDAGAWHLLEPSIDGAPVYGERGGVYEVVAGVEEDELWALTFRDKTRPYRELEVLHLQAGTWSKLEGMYEETYSPALAWYDGKLVFQDTYTWYDVQQGWQELQYSLPDRWVQTDGGTFGIAGDRLMRVGSADDTRLVDVPVTSALWGVNPEALWIALGNGGLSRLNYSTGEMHGPSQAVDTPWHTTTGIEWTASETDAWRGPQLEHFDGTTWTAVTSESNAPYVERISGSGPNDVWFVGTIVSGLWHWDGNAVQAVAPSNPDARAVRAHAFDADTTWVAEALESSVSIQSFEAGGWSEVKTWTFDQTKFANYVVEISGASASDVYVALLDHVEHFDGDTWTTVFVAPEGERFTAMVADGDRVWVLGEDYVYHRDANGDWQQQWYGFQTMSWLGLTEDAVWMMGGWSTNGVLRATGI